MYNIVRKFVCMLLENSYSFIAVVTTYIYMYMIRILKLQIKFINYLAEGKAGTPAVIKSFSKSWPIRNIIFCGNVFNESDVQYKTVFT